MKLLGFHSKNVLSFSVKSCMFCSWEDCLDNVLILKAICWKTFFAILNIIKRISWNVSLIVVM